MGEIAKILGKMPQEKIDDPVCFPACNNAEFKWLLTASDAAVNRISVAQKSLQLHGESYTAKVLTLPKPMRYGEPTSLILRADSTPELEGMILGSSPTKVCRPIFRDAKYVMTGSSESKRLRANLEYLSLEYPTSDGIFLQSFITLLSMASIEIGDNFIENINSFSDWLISEHPSVASSIWGMLQ